MTMFACGMAATRCGNKMNKELFIALVHIRSFAFA
jgi:prolipoprotein diacylglyceryltransferase